jgi:phosphatidylinositol 3-kinase
MDTFVKSCAASCVITYILGIGDRHLDNIMVGPLERSRPPRNIWFICHIIVQICPNGQLFHIDFGFIFGQDPKPLPPPFRFTREMADAMGGENSQHYAKFKSYCCQAYNWLRKSANLILNLLSLMGDAGTCVDTITVFEVLFVSLCLFRHRRYLCQVKFAQGAVESGREISVGFVG